MKRYINLSIIYAIAALIGGVYFRELTKFNNFTSTTTLGKVHTHLFILGMFFFLIVALFVERTTVTQQKLFNVFSIIYNSGLVLTTIMMTIRGTLQVLGKNLSNGLNASISGISGIGHILTGIGILLFLFSLRNATAKKS